MDEYVYDNAGANAARLPLFVLALLAMGFDLFLGTQASWVTLHNLSWLFLLGPTLMGLYFYDLWRHYRHRDDRIVLEEDQVTLWQQGQSRSVPRRQVEYAYHTGALLHIKLENEQPIQLPARFLRQEELIARLGARE